MSLRSLLLVALLLALPAKATADDVIISQTVAQRHGLVRAWYTQIELNRANDHIAYITQQGGMLYVQTEHATVHALDAETGRKLWNVQIGRRNQISMAPGVNADLLAVINGSTLYVVDRKDGKLKYERQLVGAPGAGPALSKKRLYVGMVDGLVQGFNLEDTHELPFVYKSAGRILVQPVVTDESLGWTTDKGYFYVADANEAKVRFRIETQGEINSRPAHWTPYIYACSRDGYVYAVNEVTGKTAWKFSSGQPIEKQPTVVGDFVYITPDLGGMFCLNGKTGEEVWLAPGITDFCSAGPGKIYAVDHLNRLTTLDQKTGSRLDMLPLHDVRFKVINQQTDRIYLAGQNGIIQCLHDASQLAPLVYTPPPLEKKGLKPVAKQAAAKESGDGEAARKPAAKKPADEPAEDADDDAAMEDAGDEKDPADE